MAPTDDLHGLSTRHQPPPSEMQSFAIYPLNSGDT